MSVCSLKYPITGMGDRFGALLLSLMALQLVLVDQNPFQPCFFIFAAKQYLLDMHGVWVFKSRKFKVLRPVKKPGSY